MSPKPPHNVTVLMSFKVKLQAHVLELTLSGISIRHYLLILSNALSRTFT